MTVLYVTSEYEGEGKTAVCATLAHMLRSKGKTTAAFKPFTDNGSSDEDATSYESLLGQKADGWPIDLPDTGLSGELVDRAKAALDRLSRNSDIVIVEGTSALSASGHNQLAQALDARVLIVSTYRPGLPASQLKSWEAVFGDRLIGFVINSMTRYAGHESRSKLVPALKNEGLHILGIIPEDRRLLAVTVSQLASHLNGRFVEINEDNFNGAAEKLVEHLMVGAMMLDNSDFYFELHDHKAAIIRGDRPDLQMGALHTKTTCLVATAGKEPIEYIRHEAEEEGVPVFVVDTDTLGTMDALNNLQDTAKFDHPLKMERMAELIDEHVELGGVYASLGIES